MEIFAQNFEYFNWDDLREQELDEEKRKVNDWLSLGKTTFPDNLKIFGWILIAEKHYTFDYF